MRRKPIGAWIRKTILFPRKRIASRALQEKSKVKTKCFEVGSCRLYAPTVPLAPHPCVRWWNTEEMPLKLTRLCLHSLRGGSSYQKPSHLRKGGVYLASSCVAILWVRGREGPFFDGPKNGPSHSPKKALRSRQGALESARAVFTLPWSPLPRTHAYVGGTLKRCRWSRPASAYTA